MFQGSQKILVFAVASLLTLGGAANAVHAQDGNSEELRSRIDRLEKQNQELMNALKNLQTAVAAPATAQGATMLPPVPPPVSPPVDKSEVQRMVAEYLASEAAKKQSQEEEGGKVGPDVLNTKTGLVDGLLSFGTPAGGYAASVNPGAGTAAPGLVAPTTHLWEDLPFDVNFQNGVFLQSKDKQFSLRINTLLQLDYRDFSHTAQTVHTATSLSDNFTLARGWLILNGSATEFVDYSFILAGGAASLTGPSTVNVLDSYLDFNPLGKAYKEQFQFRIGRFKTPYLYQFYKMSPQDFIAPELSMFSTNFLQNRQLGAMAHGFLFDKRIDYAAGLFNGAPNTFEVAHNSREGIFFLALQPFAPDKNSFFKNLIFSGSYAAGQQNGFVIPPALGTAVPSGGPPDNLVISPTFLTFGPTTTQAGFHNEWAAELIWNIKSFNFYGELTGGKQTYGLTTTPFVNYPVTLNGYSVTLSYFLTGEESTPEHRRIKPVNPYNPLQGGLGAFELFGRFSNLTISDNVFTDKLANRALFANSVNATDIGVNWYWNEYIKIVFDWQHAMFNQPISLTGAPGGNLTNKEDIFWLRFQLYY